jgi:hypothetical protein
MIVSEDVDEEDDPDVELRSKSEPTRKSTRIVTKFIVPDEDDQECSSEKITRHLDSIRTLIDPHQRRKALRKYADGIGSTATNLESLVSCYDELKQLNALNISLTVQGKGRFSFQNLFRHMKNGITDEFAIFHGGARFYRWYANAGFALKLIDSVQERSASGSTEVPVWLYIPADVVLAHKAGARLRRIVEQHDDERNPYFCIYWIGGLERNDKGSYNVSFKSLDHLVVRLKHPKTKSTIQE